MTTTGGLFSNKTPTPANTALAYAIGDLHGRFDLLCEGLSRAERHAGANGGQLIILGDFVDRGPQSRSIIDLLMAGPSLPNWEWIVLQGNHEAMMLECLANPGLLPWWIGNGGGETLRSYGYAHGDELFPLQIPQEHLDWLGSLPVWIEREHHIFVHAGVPYDTPIDEASKHELQWMLYGPHDYGDTDEHVDARHISGKHIVHGHHQSAHHPLLTPHRTNLDSFAWHTGRSAVGVFDTAQPGGPTETLWAERAAA